MSYLSLYMTYNCTARCRDCCFRCSPRENGVMLFEDVHRYLCDGKPGDPVSHVGFGGGEPFLYPELLIRCVREATKLGITSDVVTNGFWGSDGGAAADYAGRLKEAGLKNMLITHDAFHQEFVATEAVRSALRAAKAAEIEEISVIGVTLVDENADNPFDPKTKRVIEALAEEFDVGKAIGQGVAWMGRAIDELTQYVVMRPIDELDSARRPYCEREDGNIRHPAESDSLGVDCEGRLQLFCGTTLAGDRERSIWEIVSTYDYDAHPLLRRFLAEGYLGVLAVAVEKGYEPLPGYADGCHVCSHARQYLRPFFPEVLVPAGVYEEQEAPTMV